MTGTKASMPMVRALELVAATGTLAPALGWVLVLLPFPRGSQLYDIALMSFPALGLIGLLAFSGAAVGLIAVRLATTARSELRRAVALTIAAPASWFVEWLVAIAWFSYSLSQPGALAPFFDVFGGAH